MILAAFPARLAYGMVGLGLYFKVHADTHSIALAGLAAGANGLVGSLTTGFRSHVIERVGSMIPLRIFVPGYALALVLVDHAHGAALLVFCSGLLGATAPPINLSVRPMWKTAVPEDQYRTAVAIDTASLNVGVILGPPLVTALALSTHPELALEVTAALILIGGISLSLLRFTKQWLPEKKVAGAPSLFKSPAMQVLLLEAMVIGFANGNFQIGIPAISTLHHQPHFAGYAFGIAAATSIFGSLLAGTLGRHILPVRGFRIIYLFWFAASVPLVFTNPGWSLLLTCALFGFIGGAEQVFYLEMLEYVRPVGSAVSALGWIWTTEGSFAAIGQSSGGLISQHFSPHACFAITSVLTGIGLVIIRAGRHRLVAGLQEL
jgi:predicted MFS family arabinose efflux permease